MPVSLMEGINPLMSLHMMADIHSRLSKAAILYLSENVPVGQKSLGMGLLKTFVKLDIEKMDFYCNRINFAEKLLKQKILV